MFYKIYEKLFFIYAFIFLNFLNCSALDNNQNLSIFHFLSEVRESIEPLSSKDKPMQILEDIDALSDLTKSIVARFEKGMFSYNPGIWYQFLKICQNFKRIDELNPADIRDLAKKINSFNEKINLYFKSRGQFLNKDEILLFNDIKIFNLLLLGEILNNDDFFKFSFSEKFLDYVYYQPKEFIEEYQGAFVATGVVGVGVLSYFLVPYLKKMFSYEKSNKPKGNGCFIFKNYDVTGQDIVVGSGFINLGNTCYMNSGLQSYINSISNEFREFLVSNQDAFKDNNIVFSFIDVLKKTRESENAYTPIEFFEIAIPKFFGDQKDYRPNKQQDVSEFMTKLSDEIINECSAKGQEIKDFDIELKRKFTCFSCKEDDGSLDKAKSLDVQLPIGLKEVSLNECLEAFSSEEEIERDCSCGCKNARSKMVVDKLPDTLRLNLKRFDFNKDGKRVEKLKIPVLFNANEFELNGIKYQLINFICHRGASARGGHYFSFVRNPDLNKWFKYNDESRTQISDQEIEKIISVDGKADGAEPYVLVFKKK